MLGEFPRYDCVERRSDSIAGFSMLKDDRTKESRNRSIFHRDVSDRVG
jgi:hypothetical protein